jgi:DNA-binding NarL/FixJ family response regulator
MKPSLKGDFMPLGLIWVDCPPSVVTAGLVHALEKQARVHTGGKPPAEAPSSIILQAGDQEGLSESVERHQQLSEDAPPILVFASHLNLPLAREALRSGASGFIHAGMTQDQLVRAVAVAAKGELVAPRELISYLIALEEPANLGALSARQSEILELVVEGLSNAEIGRRLFLSESTIKQHLRAAYKILGVNNRTEAANLIRRGGAGGGLPRPL